MRLLLLLSILISATAGAEPRHSVLEPGTLGAGHLGVRVGFFVTPDAPSLGGGELMIGLGRVDIGITLGGFGFDSDTGLAGGSFQAKLADIDEGAQLSLRLSGQLDLEDTFVETFLMTSVLRLTFGDRSSPFGAFIEALVAVAPNRDGATAMAGGGFGVMVTGDHLGAYASLGVATLDGRVFPLLSLGVVAQ